MPKRVAYPGREGAHSAAACDRLFPDGVELVPLPTFSAVAEAVADDNVDYGVLPIESSLAGPVAETHDLLYDSPLSIAAQTMIPIHHCLVGLERIPLEQVRVVRSHPTALDQCRQFLATIPWATAIAAATTVRAAQQVAEDKDPNEVAIASERAASAFGLEILEEDVGDHPEAYTRFVALTTHTRLDCDGEDWRLAFSFVTDHRPGALYRALEPFSRHNIDLVQLVSRPIPRAPWRYRFDAVLAGFPLDSVVSETLTEMRALTRELRVFGSYPAKMADPQ
ncbi:MAG: prephenate dehydratase domain-containing protein [Gaiellaceae bacterium]|jgi:prephenate dehydratase